MAMAPRLADSTREERQEYVRTRYQCIGNCDLCGQCAFFHGNDPEHALQPYIDGEAELAEVLMEYRYR